MPQEEVFEHTMNDIIKSSVLGYNGTIFAYGQTGSGKTFTISGAPSNFAYRGIISRSISNKTYISKSQIIKSRKTTKSRIT